MANHHYGRIGDVWKHLPLAQVLDVEQPAEYWESHAGSACYPLTRSWERDYGVFHFLSQAQESRVLDNSNYRRLLGANSNVYPGSSEIAMRMLGRAGAFLLCDTDPESMRSLRESAAAHGITSSRLVERDGNDTLWEETQHLTPDHAERLFALLDPWNCLAPSQAHGVTSIDLFGALRRKGATVMLWFGFDTLEQRNGIVSWFDGGWLGEIQLDVLKQGRTDLNPGVLGCGVCIANALPRAIDAVETLGKELARIYECVNPRTWGDRELRFSIEHVRIRGSLRSVELHLQQSAREFKYVQLLCFRVVREAGRSA